jgi:hypothetical protein
MFIIVQTRIEVCDACMVVHDAKNANIKGGEGRLTKILILA